MATIQHLIAALGKVQDAYAPYAPDPNDDPDDTDDPEGDPGNDDGDPLDDARSYPDDDDQDEESDFRKRKPIGTVMLLERLEQQAEFKADQDRSLAARRLRIKAPPTKLQQKSEKLMELRRKTNAVEQELMLNRKLELETERLQKARVELYRGNQTAADRMQLEADTDRMADWASSYCKEAGSDWREQAAAGFGSQYQPPVDGRSPKKVLVRK